jgi:hypothetical protein
VDEAPNVGHGLEPCRHSRQVAGNHSTRTTSRAVAVCPYPSVRWTFTR